MLQIGCGMCRKILKVPGGLLFGPPEVHPMQTEENYSIKLHLCLKCWDLVKEFVDCGGWPSDGG